ncbi:MAG: acetolactate synthase [Beijerinckiaceae bacterium]|nr:acetolactate synthase [Beijerinckiaceae bacterium]
MATVGQIIVETLAAHGLDRVFCVPGESYLGLLDALYGRADIDTVTCRHEGGAGFMAVADARLTGRPGVVCVSRGPGASNAAIAVHTAQQDAVPLLLIVGQVARADIRRDAFQEIDYRQMFGAIAKWTAEVLDPSRIAEILLRALRVATTGVPGPVVIAIPEDVLTETTAVTRVEPQPKAVAAPSPDGLNRIGTWLARASRPLVIAGVGLDRPGGRESLLAFADAWTVPVLVSFRRHDLMANAHPLFAGDLGLSNPPAQIEALRQCDLLLALGTRLGDITTQGYAFPRFVRPEMPLVHVHEDPAVLGTHFAADLALACDPATVLNALGPPSAVAGVVDRVLWAERLRALRDAQTQVHEQEVDDGVPFGVIVEAVAHSLPSNAIVTVDAGTFGSPVYRSIPFKPPQRLLAPISGAMGFGVPAAVAAALRDPARPVVCFVGDGGFLMSGSELAVAAERKLPLKIILSENGSYGSIRIHQERDYPGRTVGTALHNPRLDLMGEAYGFAVTRIDRLTDVAHLQAALAAPGPQFILVRTSLAAVLPQASPAERTAEAAE